MKTTTKKAFSLIEISFVLLMIATLTTFAVNAAAETQETVQSVTTLTVPEQEAHNAINVIATEGINNSNLFVTKDYVSDLESHITIKPIKCSDGIGHVITIQEKDSEFVNTFDTCDFNNQFNFTVSKI